MSAPINSTAKNEQTKLEATLMDNLGRYQLLPYIPGGDPQPLVIGVSGGADSVGLLYAMVCCAEGLNLRVHVAHVDHGLRAESSEDARFVQELSDRLGCPLHQHVLDPASLVAQPGGIEAAARNARYAFLCQVANNVTPNAQVPIVATAHHADDQAETVLLHLVRGSGLRGLGSMRWKRTVTVADYKGQIESNRKILLIRPLLNLRCKAIRAYLHQHQANWREDASNTDTTLTRNFLRHEVLPKLAEINPQIVVALCRAAEVVGDDIKRLDALDREHLKSLMVESACRSEADLNPDRIVINLDGLMALSRAEQRGVIRAALAGLANPADEFGFETVERLLDRLSARNLNSGPHPIVAGISWSIVLRYPDQLPVLSLHRSAVLPISMTVAPQLDAQWQPARLDVGNKTGNEITIDGWRLTVNEMSVADLPSSWRSSPSWEAWLDAEKVGIPTLTTPSPGMLLAPFGMKGQTKSVGDLFTDAKVHPSLRPGWPIIIDYVTNTVLWVCGQRIAHAAQIDNTTRRVLHLAWLRGTKP